MKYYLYAGGKCYKSFYHDTIKGQIEFINIYDKDYTSQSADVHIYECNIELMKPILEFEDIKIFGV